MPISLAGRLCRRMVRAYPRAWRQRYADEVLAMLEQGGGGWRECGDLVCAATTEWVSPGSPLLEEERTLRFALRRLPRALCLGFVTFCALGILTQLAVRLTAVVYIAVAHPPGVQVSAALMNLTPVEFLRYPIQFLLGSLVGFGYSLLGGLPTALLLSAAGIGRGWPVAARLLSLAGFLWMASWLFYAPAWISFALSGWVLFTVVFPRARPFTAPPVHAVV